MFTLRRHMTHVLIGANLLMCALFSCHAYAQVETLTVNSSLFHEAAQFSVALPNSYETNASKSYVVLLDLHPRAQAYLTGMHDWMSHNGEWPWLETIIVTPPDGHQGLGQLKTAAIEEHGNEKLLDFMERDLLPAIDKRYRTNGFRILNGFTGNAGLSLYTLLNRPQLFNAYFAASPVLSEDFAFVMKDAPQKLKSMKGKPRFLFMSTSDSDFEQKQLADFAQLEAQVIANAPSTLRYQIKRFDGSYYMTQPILATAHAIEMVFNDVHQVLEPDSAISQQGVQAILQHFKRLSEDQYGFTVSAVDSLLALGQSHEAGQLDKAIEVYQQTIAAYPKAHDAYHALARAYDAQGLRAQAIKFEQLALENTEHPFFQHKYRQQLATFQGEAHPL